MDFDVGVDRSTRRRARRDPRKLVVARCRQRLDDRVAVCGWLLVGGWLGEQLVEVAGEVALEVVQRALGGLPVCFFAREVGLGGGVVLGACDRDDVERVVELAVAVAVEPMLGALSRGARDRGSSGLLREARL